MGAVIEFCSMDFEAVNLWLRFIGPDLIVNFTLRQWTAT